MKRCDHCRQLKEDEEFNWRFKELGIRANTCRECAHIHNKKYFEGPAKERHLKQVKERKDAARDVARQYAWEYLCTHPCTQCGESDPMVLEFHHREGSEKDMAVGYMVSAGYSIPRIQSEIDKCDVLCANCHRRVTMKERGWFRGKK